MTYKQQREARRRLEQRAAEKGVFSCWEEAAGVGELIHNGTMPSEDLWKDLEGSQEKDGSPES